MHCNEVNTTSRWIKVASAHDWALCKGRGTWARRPTGGGLANAEAEARLTPLQAPDAKGPWELGRVPPPESPGRTSPADTGIQTPHRQNCGRRTSTALSPPVHAALLQKPRKCTQQYPPRPSVRTDLNTACKSTFQAEALDGC